MRTMTTTHKTPLMLMGSFACALATSCVNENEGGSLNDESIVDDTVHHDEHESSSGLVDVLRVTVSEDPVRADDAEHLLVEFTLENTTDAPIAVLTWGTPFDKIGSNMFELSYEGERVPYIGRVAKRGQPIESDYITIESGASLTTTVDLSELYATRHTGEYGIRYIAHVTTKEQGAGLIRSNGIREVLSAELSYPERHRPRSGGLSFSSCSAAEQETLRRSMGLARSYTDSALSNLQRTPVADRSASPRYTTWFGGYTAQRYQVVEDNFEAIDDALSNESVHFDCSCYDSLFAYVYPHDPYDIYVCGSFWSTTDIGTNSRAGTIIHEVSHFAIVADTDDHAYGHGDVQHLAYYHPNAAIANADSYEYFAENNGWLAMSAGASGNNNSDGFWGRWGDFSSCPPGQFVYGYHQRSEPSQGSGDDTALNDIELYCASPNSSSYSKIWSAYTERGSFGDDAFCSGGNNPVVGFDVQVQSPGSGDETSANAVDLYCDQGGYISAPVNTSFGDWTNVERCPVNQAVTGLLTRVESDQGSGDDTALNGLRLVCSDF